MLNFLNAVAGIIFLAFALLAALHRLRYVAAACLIVGLSGLLGVTPLPDLVRYWILGS